MPTFTDQFLSAIEAHLKRTGTKPTEFGRAAVGDPSLVLGLRRGLSPRLATVDRVVAYMRANGGPVLAITVEAPARDR